MKKKSNKKILIIITTLTLLILVIVGTYVLGGSKVDETSETSLHNSQSEGTPSQNNGGKAEVSIEDNSSSRSDDAAQSSPQAGGSSVAPPPIDQPSATESFPVENAHYRIDQRNASYQVTLFAILNSPSQTEDYNAQIRQYRDEARQYLESRFGANVKIIWIPENAASI